MCGQEATTERYTFGSLARELYHNLRKIDATATFFTFIELLSHPGEFVRGYLDGKRVGFINPFKFYLYALLTEVLIYAALFRLTGDQAFSGIIVADSGMQLVGLFSTVFWGLFWKLFYRRTEFNTAEFAVAAVFFGAQNIFIGLVIQLMTTPLREEFPSFAPAELLIQLSVTSLYSYYYAREMFRESWLSTIAKQTLLIVIYAVILVLAFFGGIFVRTATGVD